jgi:hypothetical protein
MSATHSKYRRPTARRRLRVDRQSSSSRRGPYVKKVSPRTHHRDFVSLQREQFLFFMNTLDAEIISVTVANRTNLDRRA